jgi:hypothetical protein
MGVLISRAAGAGPAGRGAGVTGRGGRRAGPGDSCGVLEEGGLAAGGVLLRVGDRAEGDHGPGPLGAGAEREGVPVVAGVAQPAGVRVGERGGQPGCRVLAGSRRAGAEGDEATLGVLVAALAAADLLGGPVGEDGAVREQGEGAAGCPAGVDGIAGLVDRADISLGPSSVLLVARRRGAFTAALLVEWQGVHHPSWRSEPGVTAFRRATGYRRGSTDGAEGAPSAPSV